MLKPPTARRFNPPQVLQDPLTGAATTCWWCRPHALAAAWPILQLLVSYHRTLTTHANPKQQKWLYMHFEAAPTRTLATITWDPGEQAEWRI